ncbi:hypothetical protein BFP97_12315 [Roseivirga sp. 4D4]|nr:hypothetical protein BFP97_12315 [Roseivirga sp. 4D4]
MKLDTVYYNQSGELTDKETGYLTFEVRQLDRKQRIHGSTARYTKSGRMTESTSYIKGEKTGTYYRFNPAEEVMMYGDYENGIKKGFWVILDSNGIILTMEEYDNTGNLIGRRDRPYSEKIDGDTLKLDSEAEFIGGQGGWNLHLRKNLKYPTEAKRYGYQGDVYISFVVLSDGRIAAPRIVKSPHEILSKESLRMLEISPAWLPAMIGDKAVDSQMTLRIVFRLK